MLFKSDTRALAADVSLLPDSAVCTRESDWTTCSVLLSVRTSFTQCLYNTNLRRVCVRRELCVTPCSVTAETRARRQGDATAFLGAASCAPLILACISERVSERVCINVPVDTSIVCV